MSLELVPYDAWTPDKIALQEIESLPWANEKTRDKAVNLEPSQPILCEPKKACQEERCHKHPRCP